MNIPYTASILAPLQHLLTQNNITKQIVMLDEVRYPMLLEAKK